ncbi:hypothetical protein G9P44_005123 [Scheffersomyces stipitis]|nr:hypothetical protein G9P44_005123 [Scheffersomyces stipitis]
MSDKQEFGQLGKIAKEQLGLDLENKDVGEVVKEGVAKFQNLSEDDKKKLTTEALGKFESAKKGEILKMTDSGKPENQEATESPNLQDNDIATVQEQQSLINLVKNVLNPNGDDPRVDQYISSTFQYISGVLYKMSVSTDKEATAKEIAEDLSERFNKWKDEREKQKAEKQNGQSDEKDAKKD